MIFKNILFILSILLTILLCLTSVVAVDEIDNNLTSDSLRVNAEINEKLSVSYDSPLKQSQTIIVDNIGEYHREMNDHTIRNAIQNANPGDTIIINGQKYDHVHIVIDKPLTIKSNVGTSLSHCSNQGVVDSGYPGIFYITSQASGTIIEGFNFNNDDGTLYNNDGYAILVKDNSNVCIKNCNISNNNVADAIRVENSKNTIIQNLKISNTYNAVRIINSDNINIKESVFINSQYGINIINSTKSIVTLNNISNNKQSGITISGNTQNPLIIYNNITENVYGVELTSSNNINILSNYIAFNSKYGVYINCEVVKIIINGNFFNQNQLNEIFNDLPAKNLWQFGGEELEVINNNYMIGIGERAVQRAYSGGVFLGYVFEINENVVCPIIYYSYESGKQWSESGNYELQLSEIKQVKKGIYSISIVDEKGNIAKDLSSVPVTFYLNKADSSSTPKESDVYKTVMMQNGTATVRFYMDEFKKSGNVITAVFPTPGTQIDAKVSKKFIVSDSDIPGNLSNTKIVVSNVNTYPNSNQELIATLKDNNNQVLVGETLTFTFNLKTYSTKTDNNGQAKIKFSQQTSGTYIVTVRYEGDDIDYLGSSSSFRVVVKKVSTKIISSNLNMIPKKSEYFTITLKDEYGHVLPNQKITFKVNGKTYSKTTNSNGVAKVKLSFSKNKKSYKINIKFKESNNYKASSKTNTIKVKYSSKTAKLSMPSINVPLKTSKTYTLSLKDGNNKGIAKQKVTIKLNGKTYIKKTNNKGQINIKIKFSKVKLYKISASYKGSKIYKKTSASGKITVNKVLNTKITTPTILAFPNETKKYTVELKDSNNKGLSKQKISIILNGKTYIKTTDSKGQASLDINLGVEKTYIINVNYGGSEFYKSSKSSGKFIVYKINTQIESYNKTYSIDGDKEYQIALKDNAGNSLPNQNIIFTVNNQNYLKTTDLNGIASINLNNQSGYLYDVIINYGGSNKYKSVIKSNKINISNKTNTIFIDGGIKNNEIQRLLSSASEGMNIEFLGNEYSDISLNINKSLNISSKNCSLNAMHNNNVFLISSNNVNITGFIIKGNSSNGIVINNSNNIILSDNIILNNLDGGKINEYYNGFINLPDYGVYISNSSNVQLNKNNINLFESGIFMNNSSNVNMYNNVLKENNYGIKYGYDVFNTLIYNNTISENIGLYIMTVPEGPTGYGIFLNNSAVNVSINQNHIFSNHIGISLDANYSTGIVITQNTITDNVLEGIRFNAGYDLADNAIQPLITDNAIYRNARGPSMMILGELSANPEGIYGNGLYNASDKLQLDPNWYGTNQIITWDNDTGFVGYGTMCPRINTSEIKFNNLSYNTPGNYSIVFYKNGEIASNLPVFDMYATLNKENEVVFDVVDGVGTFAFNLEKFNDSNNIIEISIGSLIYSTSRVFKVTYSYKVPEREILI